MRRPKPGRVDWLLVREALAAGDVESLRSMLSVFVEKKVEGRERAAGYMREWRMKSGRRGDENWFKSHAAWIRKYNREYQRRKRAESAGVEDGQD